MDEKIRNFYSHAPCGARHARSLGKPVIYQISTHTPHAGRDRAERQKVHRIADFYSHAPCGARPSDDADAPEPVDFYSHAPCGARLCSDSETARLQQFLLTRPMRGATRGSIKKLGKQTKFLLTRPMRGATDATEERFQRIEFLLTRPMRGATRYEMYTLPLYRISTHTPHAGRDFTELLELTSAAISTHTPHAGRDSSSSIFPSARMEFLLTRPMRGATPWRVCSADRWHFYSHAPCGARRRLHSIRFRLLKFLLTRPMRGATESVLGVFLLRPHFYSHAPCGARHAQDVKMVLSKYFYSHAPCGARHSHPGRHRRAVEFLLTRPMRGATLASAVLAFPSKFLLTRPMRGATGNMPKAGK